MSVCCQDTYQFSSIWSIFLDYKYQYNVGKAQDVNIVALFVRPHKCSSSAIYFLSEELLLLNYCFLEGAFFLAKCSEPFFLSMEVLWKGCEAVIIFVASSYFWLYCFFVVVVIVSWENSLEDFLNIFGN